MVGGTFGALAPAEETTRSKAVDLPADGSVVPRVDKTLNKYVCNFPLPSGGYAVLRMDAFLPSWKEPATRKAKPEPLTEEELGEIAQEYRQSRAAAKKRGDKEVYGVVQVVGPPKQKQKQERQQQQEEEEEKQQEPPPPPPQQQQQQQQSAVEESAHDTAPAPSPAPSVIPPPSADRPGKYIPPHLKSRRAAPPPGFAPPSKPPPPGFASSKAPPGFEPKPTRQGR